VRFVEAFAADLTARHRVRQPRRNAEPTPGDGDGDGHGADNPRRARENGPVGVTPRSYTAAMPSKHPRIAVTADDELVHAIERVRAATGTHEPDATLVRRLAVEGAEVELAAGRERRAAAEALFALMDDGRFALDPSSIDELNEQPLTR